MKLVYECIPSIRAVSIFFLFFPIFYINTVYAGSIINIPVDNKLYVFSDDIYNFIDRLSTKGVIGYFPKNIRPYSQGDVAKMLEELSSKVESGEVKLSPIDKERLETIKSLFTGTLEGVNRVLNDKKTKKPLLNASSDEYYFSAGGGLSQALISRYGKDFIVEGKTNITSLRPSISGQIKDSFAFSSNMNWEFHVGDIFPDLLRDEIEFSYPKLHMKNVASMQGYGKFKLPWFELELGKDSVKWGPGYRGQLVISDNPQAMDMIKLDARYGKIGFQSLIAKLRSSLGSKYMAAHRVELLVRKGMNFGLSEVVVYGDRFEASYSNPFQIYLITEGLTSGPAKTNDNVLAGVDFSYRIVNGFTVYGEMVVDDAAPFKDPLNHWDTKFGLLGGMHIVDPLSVPNTDIRLEYAFINQYCYTHEMPINTYKHINSSIGHWLGSDADDLWCELTHRVTDKIGASLTYDLERHGEGGIDKPHPGGYKLFPNDRWKFLSGINQSRHSFSLGASYTKIGYYYFKVGYTQSLMRNIGNSKGNDGSGWQGVLEGGCWF